jgi:hypothetical protein
LCAGDGEVKRKWNAHKRPFRYHLPQYRIFRFQLDQYLVELAELQLQRMGNSFVEAICGGFFVGDVGEIALNNVINGLVAHLKRD